MEETEARPSIVGAMVLLVGAVLIVVAVGFLTYGIYAWINLGAWIMARRDRRQKLAEASA